LKRAAFAMFGLLVPSVAQAAGDGAYGRLSGDLALVVGAGGGVLAHDGRPFGSADARLRYLEVAGASLSFDEADTLGRAGPGQLRRAALAGVELRPLFPVRFLKARQTGRAIFDLTLDSLALDVGAVWTVREGRDAARPGMYAGLAIEAPLAARADGLWLRLWTQLRWTAPSLEGDRDPSGRTLVLGLGVAWHATFAGGLVQRGDEPLR
jgi:hypothetical protein